MYLIFNDEISFETVKSLIFDIQEHTKEEKRVHLYFSSNGGSYEATVALIDFLNNNDSMIELIAYDKLYSGGAITFFKFEGSKRLMDTCSIMFHLASMDIETRDSISPSPNLSRDISDLDRINKSMLKLMKQINYPKKYIKKFKKGKDVYLWYQQWSEFVDKSLY